MGKVLIHIGSGKTGTSSIQNALYLNNEHFDFTYPVVSGNGHQNIDSLFKNYHQVSRSVKSKCSKDNYKKFKDNFRKRFISNIDCNKNLVLSSEYLFDFSEGEVKELKDFLNKMGFSEFKIIVYLRSPSSFYLSFIQQRLKASYKIPSPFDFRVEYMDKISIWQSCFGSEAISVNEFSPHKMLKGNVVEDFFDKLKLYFEIDFDFDFFDFDSKNESLSAENMCLMKEYRYLYFKDEDNLFRSSSTVFQKALSLPKEIGTKPILKSYFKKIILSNNFEDIRKLSETFNVFNEEIEELDISPTNRNEYITFNGELSDLLSNDLSDKNLKKHLIEVLDFMINKNKSIDKYEK